MKQRSLMNQAYFVAICALIILISISYETSYAYFSASITTSGEDPTTTITTKELKDLVITGRSFVSSDNMIPGDSVSATFIVENPNDVAGSYGLKWQTVTNTFVNTKDLIVSLKKTGDTTDYADLKTFPTEAEGEVLANKIAIPAGTTQEFTLTVTYQNDLANNQIADEDASFNGTIVFK